MPASDITAQRHGNNRNSIAAHERVDKELQQLRIVAHLKQVGDANMCEISRALKMCRSSVSARLAELKRDKVIVSANVDRLTIYNRKSECFCLKGAKI